MVINLLTLALVLGLCGLFVWLTWRAIRARQLWVKLAGGLGAGLTSLLLAAVSFVAARGLASYYFPGAPPAPDLRVAGTPEQIARGQYLANIGCVGCHGQPGPDGKPAGPVLSGGYDLAAAEGFGFMGQMATENLTSGGKLATYTDGEIFRVLRHGADKNGRALAMMSSLPYRELSDDDLQALVAYLRSLPPTESTGPTGDRFSFLGFVLVGLGLSPEPEPILGVVTAPPAGITAEYGRYVATFGECRGCHGPDMTGTPASAFGPAIPNPRPLVSTLSLEQFTEMMRTGVRPDGTPLEMPWQNASRMSSDDLAALYLYITTAP